MNYKRKTKSSISSYTFWLIIFVGLCSLNTVWADSDDGTTIKAEQFITDEITPEDIGFRTEDPGPFLSWPLPSSFQLTDITRLPDSDWTHTLLGITDCPPYPALIDDGLWNGTWYPGQFDTYALPGTTRDRVRWQNIDNGGQFYNAFACYGANPSLSLPDHAGTDISAPNGTNVLAAAPANQVYVVIDGAGDYRVRLRHPNVNGSGQTWYTFYVHLSSSVYPVGTTNPSGGIPAGQVIGGVGNGHLHFQTAISGNYSNVDARNLWGIDQSPWDGCLWLDNSLCASIPCCGCINNLITSESNTIDWILPGQVDNVITEQFPSPHIFPQPPESPQLAITTTVPIVSREVVPPALEWPGTTAVSNPTYHLYWGTNANGTGTITQTETSYSPAPVTEPGTYYLRVAVADETGQLSEWQTAVIWQYDPTPPSGTLSINNGSETVPSLPVTLQLDVDSDVTEMRFSPDGTSWTEWETFRPSRRWQLAHTEGEQTVYAQVRDKAGNVSEIMAAEVTAVLNPDPPSSASYTVACSNVNMGGGTVSSNGYTVHHTIGQLHETGTMNSNSYQVRSGFWGACGAALGGLTVYLPFVTR